MKRLIIGMKRTFRTKISSPKVTLGSFNTISIIGKGSYAKVLLVKKKDTGKCYAMKVLKKDQIEKGNQQSHIRIEREILIKTSKHPFVVTMHYAFQNERNLYFVLDYCNGGELFNLLQKRKRLNEEETRFYAAQLVLAIEHLHDHGVIYRDLKPENVLIDSDGYLKITDFGLSNFFNNLEDMKGICGTPEYLAPEVIENKGYGKSVDWWALGSIVYEMLVGFPPFYNQNKVQLFNSIKHEEPAYPKLISDKTKRFLKDLLKKDPKNRLGAINGAIEIKNHPWFSGINWVDIYNKNTKPFYMPIIQKDEGLANFDECFTNMPLNSPQTLFDMELCKNFEDFTWNEEVVASSSTKNKKRWDKSIL